MNLSYKLLKQPLNLIYGMYSRSIVYLRAALTNAAMKSPDRPGTNPMVCNTKYGNSCKILQIG